MKKLSPQNKNLVLKYIYKVRKITIYMLKLALRIYRASIEIKVYNIYSIEFQINREISWAKVNKINTVKSQKLKK